MNRLSRQDVFAIVAMLLFALVMGAFWVLTHSFSNDFTVGFAVGGIFVGALVFVATGSRGGAGR